MAKYTVVIPSVSPQYTATCLDQIKLDPASILVVDNSARTVIENGYPVKRGYNHGVAASWNMGIDKMYADGTNWTIICSAAMRFGEPGGLDLIAHIDAEPDSIIVEAGAGVGWHFIAISRGLIDRVGCFDENFYPGYMEDVDYGRRILLSYRHPTGTAGEHTPQEAYEAYHWIKPTIDATVESVAHGWSHGHLIIDLDVLARYYYRKWGGPHKSETYQLPFGDRPIDYWPKPDPALLVDRRSRE